MVFASPKEKLKELLDAYVLSVKPGSETTITSQADTRTTMKSDMWQEANYFQVCLDPASTNWVRC